MYVCDINDINLERDKYSCVYMNWGLCYLEDDEALNLLNKIHDVLFVGKNSP